MGQIWLNFEINGTMSLKSPPQEIIELSGAVEIFFSLSSSTLTKQYAPLHIAARNGKIEVCELLINTVQDKNPRNHRGMTPFQEATESGHWTLKLHKLLSDNGADLDPTDDNEFAAKFAAMQSLRERCEPSMTFWAIYTAFSFSVIYTAFRMSSP